MPFTFVPFSSGIRGCLGKHISKLEAKVMMSQLLHHYKLEPHPDQNYEIFSTLSTRPKYELLMKTTSRQKSR